MLARVHFIVRTDPADPPGAVDPNALAEMLADATRMWDDDFSWCSTASSARSRPSLLFRAIFGGVPGQLQGQPHAVRRGA